MRHARARLAVLALGAVCAIGVVAPAQAGAAISYFNCVNKPSGQWCDGRANGSYDGQNSWDYVEAWNPGAGTFEVCQRVFKPSSGNWLTGNGCGSNWTAHYYGNVQCACYDAEVRQNSGSPKSVNGFADSAW